MTLAQLAQQSDSLRPIVIELDLAKFLTVLATAAGTAVTVSIGAARIFVGYLTAKDKIEQDAAKKRDDELAKLGLSVITLADTLRQHQDAADESVRQESGQWRQTQERLFTDLMTMHKGTVEASLQLKTEVASVAGNQNRLLESQDRVAEGVSRQQQVIEKLTDTVEKVVPLVEGVDQVGRAVSKLADTLRRDRAEHGPKGG